MIDYNTKLAIVDADFLMYYICPNKVGTDENKTLEDCCNLADEFIQNLLTSVEAEAYVLCFTVGRNFRYNVDSEYKANRKELPVIPHLKETKKYLIDKYNGLYHLDLEADDIVNILKNIFVNGIIISPDKDILKCIEGKHYNPRVNEFVTTTKEEADYNFWASVIIGDTSDNIKGLKGKAKAFVTKLFMPVPMNSFTEQMLTGESYYINQPKYIRVLEAYCEHYKDFNTALEEFYKNYKLLKILDSHPDFEKSDIINNLVGKIHLIKKEEAF